MPRFRLSIAGMLGVVAVLGVWLASLRVASPVWLAVAATTTVGLLLTAVLGAVLLRGPRRGFWLGFAVFGWAYLVLVGWDWVGGPLGHDLTSGLRDLAEYLLPDPSASISTNNPKFNLVVARQREVKLGNFEEIGRMSLSLLFGLLGGMIGRSMAARESGGWRVAGGG